MSALLPVNGPVPPCLRPAAARMSLLACMILGTVVAPAWSRFETGRPEPMEGPPRRQMRGHDERAGFWGGAGFEGDRTAARPATRRFALPPAHRPHSGRADR